MNLLRWFFGIGPPKLPNYARIDLDEWRKLPPGQIKVFHEGASGNSWAVMHLDDFDHIAGVSNLQRRELVKPELTP